MAKWGKCDYSEFKEFADKLEKLTAEDINDLCIKCSKQLAARLLALVIPRTPVGVYPASTGKVGGTLRRGWTGGKKGSAASYAQSLPVRKSGSNYIITIENPVEYASYVEFGHRTVNGGWVEGKYMLTISEERLKNIAPRILEKMIYQKLQEVVNGRN